MDLPKRKNIRLADYDYSTPNAYFITICTTNRENLFWTDTVAFVDCPESVPLTAAGKIVQQCILDIPKHYPAVAVERFVIMPNHIHLLLRIHAYDGGRSLIAPTVSTVVRHMKGIVSKQAGWSLWQKGFYDHVVRHEADFLDIWQYIEGNPSRWVEDKLNSTPM